MHPQHIRAKYVKGNRAAEKKPTTINGPKLIATDRQLYLFFISLFHLNIKTVLLYYIIEKI